MDIKKALLTDQEIDRAWENARFGNQDRRDVIQQALDEIARGFATGHTAACICKELGLLSGTGLSKKGLDFIRAHSIMKHVKEVAWRHVLDTTDGIEGNEPMSVLSFDHEQPFGIPGIDFSEEYPVTSTKLYTVDGLT